MIRQVMEQAGLVGFAELGIIIFVVSFLMILINAFFGMSDEDEQEVLHMPLDSGEIDQDSGPQAA